MRKAPALMDYTNPVAVDGVNIYTATAATIGSATPNMVRVDSTGFSGLTQYRPYSIQVQNGYQYYMGFSAEL